MSSWEKHIEAVELAEFDRWVESIRGKPVPMREWAKEGNHVVYPYSGWIGVVVRVMPGKPVPLVRVKWARTGHEDIVPICHVWVLP